MQELVKSFLQSLIQNMNIPLIQEGFGQPFFANGCTSLRFLAGGSGSGRASDTWEPRAENSPGNFSWSNEIPGPASSLSGCRQWAKMNHQICRDSAVIYETRLGFSRELVGDEHPNLFKSQWEFVPFFLVLHWNASSIYLKYFEDLRQHFHYRQTSPPKLENHKVLAAVAENVLFNTPTQKARGYTKTLDQR